MIEELIERMFERARQQLAGQVRRNQPRLPIDVFVSRHWLLDESSDHMHIIGRQHLNRLRTPGAFGTTSFESRHQHR